MAVAIEFVNVIVRKAAVDRRFPGGLDGFARLDIPNLTKDDYLLRVGFMNWGEADGLIGRLEAAGMRFAEADPRSDILLLWSGGPTPPGLTVGAVDGYSACWASDYPTGDLALPEPGFILRCPRQLYRSLPGVVGRCGAELSEAAGELERGMSAKFRCVRGPNDIAIDVTWDDIDETDILFELRHVGRRAHFVADVALIRDLVAVLREAGAED